MVATVNSRLYDSIFLRRRATLGSSPNQPYCSDLHRRLP
jgi:hypothetical protein